VAGSLLFLFICTEDDTFLAFNSRLQQHAILLIPGNRHSLKQKAKNNNTCSSTFSNNVLLYSTPIDKLLLFCSESPSPIATAYFWIIISAIASCEFAVALKIGIDIEYNRV